MIRRRFELEEGLEAVESVIKVQHMVGNYDVSQIYEAVQKEKEKEKDYGTEKRTG